MTALALVGVYALGFVVGYLTSMEIEEMENEAKYCVLRGPYWNVFWTRDTGDYSYHDQNTGERGEYEVLGKGLTEEEVQKFFPRFHTNF